MSIFDQFSLKLIEYIYNFVSNKSFNAVRNHSFEVLLLKDLVLPITCFIVSYVFLTLHSQLLKLFA